MKKLIAIGLLSAAIVACNNEADTTQSGPTVDSATNKVYSTSVTLDTAVNPMGSDTAGNK